MQAIHFLTQGANAARKNGASASPTASDSAPPPQPRPRTLRLFLPLALIVLMGAFFLRGRPVTVRVTRPVERTVTETIAASGQVHGNVESNIGSDISGRVARVLVKEGDEVRQGQALAFLETHVLEAQRQQAAEDLRVARARLTVSSRPALPSEIARVRADTAEAVAVARANLDRTQQRLAELRRGPTPEARAAARAQLDQARAHLSQATQDLQRQRALFGSERIRRAAMDEATTNLKVAGEARQQAEEQLAQARRDLEKERQLYSTTAHTAVDDAENVYKVAQRTLDQRSADLALANQEVARQEKLFQGGATPRASLDQARAAADVARAARELANSNLNKALTDLQHEQSLFRDGKVPRAGLDRAESTLRVSNNAADQARLQLAQAQRELDRQQQLYVTSSRADLDHAAVAYDVAQGEFAAAQAQLRDLQIGTRPEVMRQAEADVASASGALQGALQSGAAQVKTVLSQPRPEDVALAQAQVDEAQQALLLATEKLREAVVLAPFPGTVTDLVTEAGGVTGAGQPILKLVQSGVPEIWLDVDENNLGRLKVGQRAVVTSSAFPGIQFEARLREIGAQVDIQRGTIQLKLRPVAPPPWLRPGQTLNVNIIVDEGSRRFTVPLSAISSENGRTSVLLLRDGRAFRQWVRTGPAGDDQVPVSTGLSPNDLVIVSPAAISPGQSVRPAVGSAG